MRGEPSWMEHGRLRKENVELRGLLEESKRVEAERESLLRQLEESKRQLEEAERRLIEAQALIAELQRQLYGPKAERLSEEQKKELKQLSRTVEEQARRPDPVIEAILAAEEKKNAARKRKRAARHPLPQDLETETVVVEPELCPCPRCGRELEKIGEEISEEIDLVPARLIRRRTVRPKYACRCGEAGVAIASLPPRLIPQSRLGLGLAVHIVLARFDDHLSFYNLERQFRERYGVVIARQQMVQWVEHIAFWLKPIYEAMWQQMLEMGYLQIDETPVRVLDPDVKGKAARGYLWFFAVPDGDVLLVFDRSRGLKPVREQLEGFCGTIQTDAYEVYQALARRDEAIRRIGCLAHARRRFFEAVTDHEHTALGFILDIGRLYRIEDEARQWSPQDREKHRRLHAPPIWAELKEEAEQLEGQLLPKSSLGKAVRYFLNDYEALIGYLEDGRYEIDNNLVENSIRPAAVGRRRWLFIGHPDAGWRSAVIYSILGSCRRRGVNPRDYLSDVLGRLPSLKQRQIQTLLPGTWKPPGDAG